MNKAKKLINGVGALGLLMGTMANAALIHLQPGTQNVNVGQLFQVEIRADIDTAEAILGFGFDLTSSGSSNVTLSSFNPGAGFADDPTFLAPLSDADKIRGASNGDLVSGVPVSGANILLGTLILRALTAGDVDLGLGADDLSFFFTEGLIHEDVNLPNSLPPIDKARIVVSNGGPVPEPPALFIFSLGILVLGWVRREFHSGTLTRYR